MVRLGSFNVENLFERAKLLGGVSKENPDMAGVLLHAVAEFNRLISKMRYDPGDKAEIIRLANVLGLLHDDEAEFVILRRNRGRLLDRRGNQLRVEANGRGDWLGWLEMKAEAVDEQSIRNTAQVVRNVNADILVVVEAEHRHSLDRFNKQILRPTTDLYYEHVMLIDGNDERGIDVGMMSKAPFPLHSIRSHIHARQANGQPLFSRDCPEYLFDLPSGQRLLVMANRLKSKNNQSPGAHAAATHLRTLQAEYIRRIYDERQMQGIDYIAIVGDLNDTPESTALAALLGPGSPLQDIGAMQQYSSGNFMGTFGNCAPENKIDYILCSPALAARVVSAGIDRSGMWGGPDGNLWPRLPGVQRHSDAASDHAALYAEIDL